LPVGAHAVDRTLRTFLADPERGVAVGDSMSLDGTAADLEVASRAARSAAADLG
jgi:hypothetical protein